MNDPTRVSNLISNLKWLISNGKPSMDLVIIVYSTNRWDQMEIIFFCLIHKEWESLCSNAWPQPYRVSTLTKIYRESRIYVWHVAWQLSTSWIDFKYLWTVWTTWTHFQQLLTNKCWSCKFIPVAKTSSSWARWRPYYFLTSCWIIQNKNVFRAMPIEQNVDLYEGS